MRCLPVASRLLLLCLVLFPITLSAAPADRERDLTAERERWEPSFERMPDAAVNRQLGVPVEIAGPGQGWRPLKLYGGSVTRLVVSPLDPDLVVAINGFFYDEGQAVFVSKNGGRSWSIPSLPGLPPGLRSATAFDAEFLPDGTLLVATYDVLMRADATLTTWTTVDVKLADPDVTRIYFFEIGVNPGDPKEIWLGTQESIQNRSPHPHLIRSRDGGSTWIDVTPNLTEQGAINQIAFNSNHPERVVVVLGVDIRGEAWRTLDGGLSWTRGLSIGGEPLNDVIHDGTRFYIGSGTLGSNNPNGGIYVSDDDGASWNALPRIGWPARVVYDLELDPARPGTILAATPAGIFRRSNGTWTFGIGGSSLKALCVAMTPGATDRVLAGYELLGVRRSEDNGASFIASSDGILSLEVSNAASNPKNPREIAATYTPVSGGGIFVSADGGDTWTRQNVPNLSFTRAEFSASGDLFAIARESDRRNPNGIYRRNPDGSWGFVGPNRATSFSYGVSDIRASRYQGGTAFACGSDYAFFNGRGYEPVPVIWRSRDSGTSWDRVYMGDNIAEIFAGCMAIEIVNDGTDQHIIVSKGGGPSRALISHDGGTTWSPVTGIPDDTWPGSLRGTPADPNTLYMSGSAVSAGRQAPSLRSLDAGASWTSLAPYKYFDRIEVDRANPNVIYGMHEYYAPLVERSVDGGQTFQPFDAGTDGVPNSFAWIEGNCPTLMMATDRGLYVRSIDSVAPQISLELEPNVLWPPDHKMKTITARVVATDGCDANPTFALSNITVQDESGATQDVVAKIGDATATFQLRAERRGKEERRYLVTYTATDANGNISEATATVRVPHDMAGAKPSDDSGRVALPTKTELVAIQPNPFNPSTSAMITLATSQHVSLDVYDVRGARVRTLVSGSMPAGAHRIAWDGIDDAGAPSASGVYFFRFVAGTTRQTMKALLVK